MSGLVTNRAAVYWPLTLLSVNGPEFTVIDGGGAARCAYLTNGAYLSGFTLTNGAGDYGGGVYCESHAAIVSNSVLVGNSASTYGGGAYSGALDHCALINNSSPGFLATAAGPMGAS